MPDLNGLDLQKMLNDSNVYLPIIFLTGYGSVPMSVRAMKAGAVEFLEKPFDEETLLSAIRIALEKNGREMAERTEILEIQRKIESLTPREGEVFWLVVKGMLNKQIAAELGTSDKTIKVHRGRVMRKMKAESLAELVRFSEKIKNAL